MSKPKIRFEGFADDWEQRKLGDCTFLSGKKNKNNLNLEPYAITNEHGFIPQNKAHDEFGYMKDTDRRAYNIVSKNSFAYNPARINIGSIGYYKGTENVIISSLYEVFQTVDSVYDPFLWQWFKTKDFQNWIIRLQEGSVRLYFYYDKLCECIIKMPKLEEQIKIANYLTNIDNLITLHQRKCDEIKKIKKYMLQNMFPQEGEKNPKIRFDEFTGDWEQRKLGDTVQITMGQSPDGTTYSDIPSDYVLIQGNADLQNGWVAPRIWTSQMTKKADAGDLIMSVRAPAGAMGKTAYNAVIGRGVAAIKGNEFIYQLLVKMDSEGFWKSLSCGSTFESLNTHNIKNADILIPDIVEQTEIGEYFSNLDHLITLHQRKCDELKKMKKFMLQNMFV